MKTIYDPAYRKIVGDLRQARIDHNLRQADAGRQLGFTRHWIRKVETCEIRLDVVQLVRLCRVYRMDASRLVRRLAEDSPEEGESSFSYQSLARQDQ